jgi:hypothetical protein
LCRFIDRTSNWIAHEEKDENMDRLRGLSLTSRTIFWLIIISFIIVLLYAFFSSRFGQTALLLCCGGAVLLIVVGLLSERGMRRPR